MCKFASEPHPTYLLRPSNGHSSPDIKCLESLYKRATVLTSPGHLATFISCTKWVIPRAFFMSGCHAALMTLPLNGAD
eukprot:663808-Pyramimonas_sp.AAC.1